MLSVGNFANEFIVDSSILQMRLRDGRNDAKGLAEDVAASQETLDRNYYKKFSGGNGTCIVK